MNINDGSVSGISEVPAGAGTNVTRAVYRAHAYPQFNMASYPVLGSGSGIDFGTGVKVGASPFSFIKHEDAKAEEEGHEPGAGYIH